jgi:hypothetical protein
LDDSSYHGIVGGGLVAGRKTAGESAGGALPNSGLRQLLPPRAF